MIYRHTSCFISLIFMALGHSTSGLAAEQADAGQNAQQTYESAMRALDNSEWESAVRQFTQAASVKGDHQDGALYWRAYAQNKLGRKDEAIVTLADLNSRFPKSRWLKDARALQAAINPTSDVDANTQGDEDLKLIAINSLMSSDPSRATALLEKLLQRDGSPKIQEKALFVLAQNSAPKAREIIADIARGKSRPELQAKAIQYLGMLGGHESRQILADVYASGGPEVKKKILQSFMLSGDRSRILAAAKSEKANEVRAAAIQQLGLMGARTELSELYSAESTPELKKAIIQAFFLSGDVDHLLPIARDEKDVTLRSDAVQKLGLMGSSKTGPALVTIYHSEKEMAPRRRVLEALFIQNNSAALVEIAQHEKDPQLRRAAVEKLSLMHSKEAQDYLMKLLEK